MIALPEKTDLRPRRQWPHRVLFCLFSVIVVFFIGGCENSSPHNAMGSIVGVALISDPDPGTGNAGILVYLAGTAFQARTDQQGRYRIEGVPPGSYDLIAEKTGFQGQIVEGLNVAGGSNQAVQVGDVMLIRQASPPAAQTTGTAHLGALAGTVLLEGLPDENGGVRVELDGTPFVTVSSTDGQYRMVNVPAGEYRLSFYKDGYLPRRGIERVRVTTGTEAEVPDVGLELMKPGDPVPMGAVAQQRAASVAAPPQEPPPGADEPRSIVGVVEVREASGRIISDYSAVTVGINGTDRIAQINDQGQFRFDNLTSDTYTLIGAVPDGPTVQIPVDLVNQRVASVSVRLVVGAPGATGGVIRGQVVLLDMVNEPLADASGVQVAVNGTQIMATTGADGVFVLEGVAAGTYSLSATKQGFKAGSAQNVEVSAAAPTEVPDIELTMDVERPRVVMTNPAAGARDVAVGMDVPIMIKFSDKMDPATVRDAVVISPATPATIAIGKGSAPGADDDTMIITLSNSSDGAPIQFGANYRITIPGTAANLAGVTMGEPFTLSFQSAKPGIIMTSPANNARSVYVDQLENAVIFSFNTKLDPTTINDRTFRVRPNQGKSVSVTYNNNDDTGWTTVRVATQWQPDTDYTISVTRRVKASNGQNLGNTPYTLKFHTQKLDIMSVPIMTVR